MLISVTVAHEVSTVLLFTASALTIQFPLFPHLILVDLEMPICNGFEFLETFEKRKLNSMDNVMIVMLTTSLHPDDLERAKSFNSVAEYVYKPLTEEKIKTLISTHFPE